MINQFDDELDQDVEEDKMKLEIAKREKETHKLIVRRLRKILEKAQTSLTIDDKKFLKARASYLSKSEREEYADVIAADYSDHPPVDETVALAEPKLEDLSRTALEARAKELGIGEPEAFPNKKALIEEITKYL